jgi:peroxiredoxin
MNSPVLRAVCAALVVAIGIWAGIRVYSARYASHEGGIRVPAGEASPPNPSDLTDALDPAPSAAKIPDHLPVFSLKDRTGKATSISAWAGRSLVINFWATWCAPCQREIPLLQALSSEWAGREVTVLGIAVDRPDEVLAFAKRFKITYPLLIGEQDALDAAAAFGVESPVFPFTVFTDRRGEVVALFVGELHKAQADLILSVVQDLNQNQVPLTEARRTIATGLGTLAARRPG